MSDDDVGQVAQEGVAKDEADYELEGEDGKLWH